MRKGLFECALKKDSLVWQAYKKDSVWERHRHRFEINPRYVQRLSEAGLVPVGIWPTRGLVEIMEYKDHPWFVGTQFHPEFLSRPNRPHPIFKGFVGAALDFSEKTC